VQQFRGGFAEKNDVSDGRLGPEEDSELRRLHVLRGFGMVAGSVTSRYEALRRRDRRQAVRDPDDASILSPTTTPAWSKKSKPAPSKPNSAPQRVVSDTREIFGDLPQPRRGRGIFRR
jgi:hypothetical protein